MGSYRKNLVVLIILCLWAFAIFHVMPLLFAQNRHSVPEFSQEALVKKLRQEIEDLRSSKQPFVSPGSSFIEDGTPKEKPDSDTLAQDNSLELKAADENDADDGVDSKLAEYVKELEADLEKVSACFESGAE
jgi:hypothetical protein